MGLFMWSFTMKRLFLILLLAGCENGGTVGLKPTDRLLADAKANQQGGAEAPYSDPYADGTQLAIEKKNLARTCAEVQKKLTVLESVKLPYTKEEKDAISTVATLMPTACASASPNLDGDLKTFSDISKKAYYLAYEHRLRALEGVDMITGTVNPKVDKNSKAFENSADIYTLVGDHATTQMQAYLMFSPLEQRGKALQAMVDTINQQYLNAPDFANQAFKIKFLGKAMTAESNDELRKKIRIEIYGVAE